MSELLPITGPLGRRENYDPTNRDLYENALKQNEAINGVTSTMKEVKIEVNGLSKTVENHTNVINQLQDLKKIALWILSFLGIGGVASFLSWLKSLAGHP